MSDEQQGQCSCGASRFTVQGQPLTRLICHCTICQQFNQSEFADITVFKRSAVNLPSDNPVEFTAYTKAVAVQRGKCLECGKPAIEFFNSKIAPNLAMVPSQNLPTELLPEPSMHAFYHRRVQDSADALPKYNGFLSSQLALMRFMLPGLLHTAKPKPND